MEKQVALATYLLALILICWTGLGEGLVVPSCDQHMFDSSVHGLCLPDFNRSMETSGYLVRCPWPITKRIYNTLKYCVDHWAKVSWCKGRGFLVDEVFLEVHKTYFPLCSSSQLQDPPLTKLIILIVPGVVFTLFLPLLCVHLTTWNTEMPSSLGL